MEVRENSTTFVIGLITLDGFSWAWLGVELLKMNRKVVKKCAVFMGKVKNEIFPWWTGS